MVTTLSVFVSPPMLYSYTVNVAFGNVTPKLLVSTLFIVKPLSVSMPEFVPVRCQLTATVLPLLASLVPSIFAVFPAQYVLVVAGSVLVTLY